VFYSVDGDKGGFSASVHYTGKARHPHKEQNLAQVSPPRPIHSLSQGITTPGSDQSVIYVPHKSFQE